MRFSVSSSSIDDVLVAREAERVVIEDLHAREEVVEVVGDELLERQVAHRVAVPRDLDEARAASAAP